MTKIRIKHVFRKTVAALIIICVASFILSKYGLTVTRYEITSPRLPDGFDGYRIVQLSDLHGSEFGKNNTRLVRAIADEDPDIIVMTGDFIDKNKNEVPEVEILVNQLMEIAPVYFVSGNHDWASGELEELAKILDDAGVLYLRNDYVTLSQEEDSVVLCGVEDPNGWADMPKPPDVIDIINDHFPNSFIILLGHRNYWVDKYPSLEVDIILCGHSHGGIVCLPGMGGLLGTNGDLLPKHEAGVFDSGRYQMIVSRGLGNAVPIPRFMNTPEIVTLNLQKK